MSPGIATALMTICGIIFTTLLNVFLVGRFIGRKDALIQSLVEEAVEFKQRQENQERELAKSNQQMQVLRENLAAWTGRSGGVDYRGWEE